jgi:cob(I)alamin adenosyltransferase
MADSDQDKQADSAFDDDLEKMLQDNTEQLSDDEEVLDDKEAIDQLLDENPGQLAADDIAPESVDDIVDSLLDDVASGQGQEANELTAEELDEFAEDPLEHLTDVSSDDIDQLLQSSDSSEPESIDEFVDEFAEEPGPVENLSELDAELTDDTEVAEASQVVADTSIDADLDIDEFAEEEPSIDVNIEPEPATEPELARPAEAPAESMTEIDEFAESEDDFLMADFDISADESEEPVAQENYASLADEPESTRVMPAEPAAQLVDSAEMQAMSERLEKLENELADYSQSSSNDKAAEQSEVLEKSLNSQKKILRETAEASGKLKILSISSLVIGVLALIIGIVVLVMTMGVPAELEEVQNTIMDIEDGLAVPDPNTQTIQALQTTVGELQAENVKLTATLTQLEQQIADNKKQSIALLKADLAQQLLEITGQLSALEEKVAKTRVVQQRVTSTRKIARKPKVQEWVVNLVSFKQRWYTDNKVAEFKKKGIPAEVLAVDIGGVEWYRIRVVGFKDKMAAGSYAVKIKKSLNLSSVWVSAK